MRKEAEAQVFNAEWREKRFTRAILQRAALIDRYLSNSPSFLVAEEHRFLVNATQTVLWKLYIDILQNGTEEEITRAKDGIAILKNILKR